ncbi:hypothetical protein KCU77_g516, partial [Aureobasidium melanogenum]
MAVRPAGWTDIAKVLAENIRTIWQGLKQPQPGGSQILGSYQIGDGDGDGDGVLIPGKVSTRGIGQGWRLRSEIESWVSEEGEDDCREYGRQIMSQPNA